VSRSRGAAGGGGGDSFGRAGTMKKSNRFRSVPIRHAGEPLLLIMLRVEPLGVFSFDNFGSHCSTHTQSTLGGGATAIAQRIGVC
jgi:hypothetical protein